MQRRSTRTLSTVPQEADALQAHADQPRNDGVGMQLRLIAAVVQSARERLAALRSDMAAPFEAIRALQALAARLRPLVRVIDEDIFQHKLLQQALAALPIDVAFATSAGEGFASLRARRAELVRMDVSLPDLDGIEATRQLKSAARFSGIPVMMTTGVGGKEPVVESLKAGAADFVGKPIDKPMLLAKVCRLLGMMAE
jgi:PleD family two-component response regulator